MPRTETLEDFYQGKLNLMPEGLKQDHGHFNVFRVEDCVAPGSQPVQYSRRDFYKITLMRGRHVYHYADKSIEVNGSSLLFFNPRVPYSFEPLDDVASGYFCIFRDAFFTDHIRGSITEFPLFQPGSTPSYTLDKKQDEYIASVFTKMIDEIRSDYRYKYDLIRNYALELVHHALKMEPTNNLYQHTDANTRITAVFIELLERQFPIESPSQQFTLRSAKHFADQLAVHVNHLNRAIRTITGKTTTDHIVARLITEARALLKHTDWNISEISYSLGFEEPAHFNHFFKKHTNTTPSAFRSLLPA
jgi:AraC family transcriptional regulator, transcriptional activator of pobA